MPARALDAREPLGEEGPQEFRLLVGQGVARVVEHGERGVRVVVDEVGGGVTPVESSCPATTTVGPAYAGA